MGTWEVSWHPQSSLALRRMLAGYGHAMGFKNILLHLRSFGLSVI